jgi:hypothetical protein
MRTVIFSFAVMAVMALAFWAYRENYLTRAVLDETQQVQARIADARARLGILRADWAYLNRPERLRELADLNFDRLGLLPFRPDQFGITDQIAYPPSETLLPITNPVDVSTMSRQNP